MKTTYTPGPWKYTFESTDPEWAVVHTNRGEVIANVRPNDANARLIAAAPEILRALNILLDTAMVIDAGNKNEHGRNCCGFAPELFESIAGVIAKATRSPNCTCDAECDGPVPPYCSEHDGDYSAFLAANNCD